MQVVYHKPSKSIPIFERLLIESQSNCNRSCWFCPRTYDRSGKYLDATGKPLLNQMPTEKILDLLDEVQALGFTGGVGFHHYSEPLLDKRNVMLAQEARKRGMKPDLHTNGDALKTNDALCEEVAKVYELVVVGLYDYRTNQELEDMKRYWQARLAGVRVEFSPIGLAAARSAHSIGIPRALVPSDARMSTPEFAFANAPCHRPLIRMIIQHDGEVCNCCEDTTGSFKLGNVYHNSIEDLWFSEYHAEVVNNLIAGHREKYSLCGNCPLSPTAPAPNGKRIEIHRRQHVTER